VFWFETEEKSKLIMKRVLLCTTLVVLIAILTITQSAIPTLVLCYGDDGHSAIKTALNDSCRQVNQDFRRQTTRTNAESGSAKVMSPWQHSATCVDIPIGNDVITKQVSSLRKSFKQLIRLTLVIPKSSITFSARSTIQNLLPYFGLSTSTNNSALFALRTVVLLN
jgi:hypothetical protein